MTVEVRRIRVWRWIAKLTCDECGYTHTMWPDGNPDSLTPPKLPSHRWNGWHLKDKTICAGCHLKMLEADDDRQARTGD